TGDAGPVPLLADQDTVTGEVALAPIHRWFVARNGALNHDNQAVRLGWNAPVDEGALRGALAALVVHHDALRLRLVGSPSDGWREVIAAEEPAPAVRVLDLGAVPPDQHAGLVERAADDAHGSLDVRSGPLLGALLVRFDGNRA